jgi:glycosyltransferase involved in cell wall biosynthesis
LNILIIYQYFGTPAGGWSTRIYELARRWVEKGAKVRVITSPYYKSDIRARGLISKQQIEGIELIVIDSGDSNKMPKWKRAYKALFFAIISTYFTLILKSDIVLASSGPITVGVPGLAAKLLKRKKLVFEVRDLWPKGAIEMNLIRGSLPTRLGLWFERLCYLNSDLVVPCSLGMEIDIKTRFPNINTVVIPNGSDIALFGKPSPVENSPFELKQPNSKVFVYFGSLGVMDACDEIIYGFHALHERENIHIVFIGDGSEKNRLTQLTLDLGLNNHVHFLGLLPKKSLVGWLKASVASFVVFKNFPVLATSSPNKMFDSFAAGLPIIQNTTGWIKELVDEHGCGLNVSPDKPESMAKAIKKISQMDPIAWKNMSDAALNLATKAFNRDKLASLYYQELTNLISPS